LPKGEGLQSKTYIFSLEEVFISQKGKINIKHIKVFSCKCYSYINLKSLLAKGRKDKLMLQGYMYMFIRYINKTIKQHKVYALDL
jgi:hypothetical protein